MSPNQHEVEIKEPPIQELNKKRSCLKRSCATGCGCIVIFFLAALGLIWFATHPPASSAKKVPSNFPVSIPIYDPDAITSIKIISGAEHNRWIAWAGYLPKFVVTPILFGLDRVSGNVSAVGRTILAVDRRDSIRIEWEHLSAQPKFIDNYYQSVLKKAGYLMSAGTEINANRRFEFSTGTIDGVLIIRDNPEREGTDSVVMTVSVP
jgi:hypothetical protein